MKPMLAATWKKEPLLFPLLASPKLDGIRALVIDEVVYSRNMKPIPNRFVQAMFGNCDFDGLDGELIVGNPRSPTCYRDTMSGVMSADGCPDVKFHVFDCFCYEGGWLNRNEVAASIVADAKACGQHRAVSVSYREVRSLLCLQLFEEQCLEMGYEGIMLRHPLMPYKHGRSTMKEQGLIKVKRFEDAEAVVIGVTERMHNGNAATKDELGRTKRTTHKANKVGRSDLGALVCRTPEGVEFNVGTGFDDYTRNQLWETHICSLREKGSGMIGRLVKYRYFPTGSKDAPRFPVFLGFRHPGDMS